jgi:hypothetical protein
MKKLDPDECSFKAFCEISRHSQIIVNGNRTTEKIPPSIQAIVVGLKQ